MVSTQGDFCPLGFVHVGQPTVLFRVSASFSEDAWMCAPGATDGDLETVSASFSLNASTCAQQSTDRDLESQRAFFVRMLGYVFVGQPTVIFRVSAQ